MNKQPVTVYVPVSVDERLPDLDENNGNASKIVFILKQEALLRFMCAIMQGMAADGKASVWTVTEIAYKAETLVEAYINQLNK